MGKKTTSGASVQGKDRLVDADDGLDALDIDGDLSPTDDSAHWLNLLRELQGKQKSGPAQTSVATQRTRQINAFAKQHREHAAAFAEGMHTYLDKFVGDCQERKSAQGQANGGTWAASFEAAARHAKATNDALAGAVRLEPRTDAAGDLPQRREDDVERACARIQAAPERRAKAHRRLLRAVREELEAVLEREKVAADATRLVANLKKVLRG
ncbi:hypothetical protein K488DRAFT_86075 [Vararia minispora EC-137]|uniref:Uncharacterized protein n=1 Tax=Vararia minispora EC-137 TaxID=1314806 RepID=A0ACB8QKM1_9AGAM|nr:hypothetical protein K488DRAFT_86075 [Vararia minispora EC-137]